MDSIAQQFKLDLRSLGVREGGVLLVHASLRSLGKLDGGAETVIQCLIDVLGDNGTLLMPALSYQTVTPQSPYFDVQTTPVSEEVGALPEYFRTRESTLRSLHPTHSVCGVGSLAQEILQDHELDRTPCGPHSPFHKLRHYDGQILFLGCGLRPNTTMHAIEELVEPPYLFNEVIDYEMRDATDRNFRMPVKSHDFDGWIQRYDRIDQVMDKDDIRIGKVLAADCHLIDAKALWSVAHCKLQEDALFFVDSEILSSTS